MTNQELADHLNRTVGLTGQNAITVNVIRQWVTWGVLPKATPKGRRVGQGPIWSRHDSGLQRATRLAELRKAGMRREAAIVAQAYLDCGDGDFELARAAILSEFIKWREQLNRRQTSFLGAGYFQSAGNWKRRAIKNQLGPLDSRFVGTAYEQTPELYAAIAQASRLGEADTPRLKLLLAEVFTKISPEIAELIPNAVTEGIINSASGLTGTPDEIGNSGEASIRKATQSQFESARKIANRMTGLPVLTESKNLRPEIESELENLLELPRQLHSQISIGPWPIFTFVQILHAQQMAPDLKQEIAEFLKDS